MLSPSQPHRPRLLCVAALFALALAPPITADTYGLAGPFRVTIDSIDGPTHRQGKTYLYRPVNTVSARSPVIFFLCGIGPNTVHGYAHICEHLASRGYCVVLPSFRMASFPNQRRTYRRLDHALRNSVDAWNVHFDTTRVGFAGHSFGAGAIPFLARPYLQTRGWGDSAVFVFAMAPFYVFRVDSDAMRALPPHTRLLIQVYAEDDVNDSRVAIDLLENCGVDAENRRYSIVHTDSLSGRIYKAHHGTPFGPNSRHGRLDLYDTVTVYRPLDALAAHAFEGAIDGRSVAFGEKCDSAWTGFPAGRAIAGAVEFVDRPEPRLPIGAAAFNWRSPWNPRKWKSPSFDHRGNRRISLPK